MKMIKLIFSLFLVALFASCVLSDASTDIDAANAPIPQLGDKHWWLHPKPRRPFFPVPPKGSIPSWPKPFVLPPLPSFPKPKPWVMPPIPSFHKPKPWVMPPIPSFPHPKPFWPWIPKPTPATPSAPAKPTPSAPAKPTPPPPSKAPPATA